MLDKIKDYSEYKNKRNEYINDLLQLSLYDSIDFNMSEDFNFFYDFLQFNGSIDFYCVGCKKDKTPFLTKSYIDRNEYTRMTVQESDEHMIFFLKYKFFNKVFECPRDSSHQVLLSYYINNDKIYKAAQYPSAKDLGSYNLNKYEKFLGENNFSELKKAIGLYSHAVGIGSFVYLRRIIESLVKIASDQKIANEESFDKEEFLRKKVGDKIKDMRGYLPDFFVDNKKIYSILSKGIHELSEEKCLEYFPVLRYSIEMILDEIIADKERKEKKKELSKSIREIHQEEKNNEFLKVI